MGEFIQGKHFSITDPQNVSTIIYQIMQTELEQVQNDGAPKYTVERLEYMEEIIENATTGSIAKKKTFFVEDTGNYGDKLVILSFGTEKVVVNMGILEEGRVRISKKPVPINFQTLYNEDEVEYKEFFYTPNLKRPISIIDPETTEEVKPVLYMDEETNEVKGKCKLKPYKNYFAFEIKEEKE